MSTDHQRPRRWTPPISRPGLPLVTLTRMGQEDSADGVAQWDDIEDEGVLDASDTLDDDAVADPLDAAVEPADRWSTASRFGTTAAEQHAGESIGQLLAAEGPDVDPYAVPGEDEDEDELIRRGYE